MTDQQAMDEFLPSVHYDETKGDWKKMKETDPPDDSAEETQEEVVESGS